MKGVNSPKKYMYNVIESCFNASYIYKCFHLSSVVLTHICQQIIYMWQLCIHSDDDYPYQILVKNEEKISLIFKNPNPRITMIFIPVEININDMFTWWIPWLLNINNDSGFHTPIWNIIITHIIFFVVLVQLFINP